jgi:hypothetical protein
VLTACLLPLCARGGDTLVEAARQREEAVRSVVVEFEVTEFTAKGLMSGLSLDGKTKAVTPPADAEFSSRNTLVFSDRMARYENNHPMWNVDRGVLRKTSSVTVTAGEVGKLYFPRDISGGGGATGIIWRDAAPSGLVLPVVTPLSTHFRGLAPHLTPYLLSDARRTDRTAIIDGRICSEYIISSDKTILISLFIDETNRFVVRRFRKLRQGNPYSQIDVRYRDDRIGLVPDRWSVTEYVPDGRVRSRSDVAVTNLVLNPDVPRARFGIEYPDGCDVFDQRTNKWYVGQADGSLREKSASGELTDTVVYPPGTPWWTRYGVWVLTGGGVLLCLLGFALRRRK